MYYRVGGSKSTEYLTASQCYIISFFIQTPVPPSAPQAITHSLTHSHTHTQTHNAHCKYVPTSTYVSNASTFFLFIYLPKTDLTPFIHGKLSVNVTLNKSVRS